MVAGDSAETESCRLDKAASWLRGHSDPVAGLAARSSPAAGASGLPERYRLSS